MIARIVAVIALVATCLPPAVAAELTTAIQLGPPVIRLERSDVLEVTRRGTVGLKRGESLLALPVDKLGVAPTDVWLRVEPADVVRIIAMQSGPEHPGAAVWRLSASRAVEATVRVSYPVKGLSWAIEYSATLQGEDGLELEGKLRVTNGLGRDLDEAYLLGEGFGVRLGLEDGQTVTVGQAALSRKFGPEATSRAFVYDKVEHGDAPAQVLTLPTQPDQVGLPAGTVRIYAPAEAGGELIREASIPYTPPGEAIELSLGPASGITVTRRRAQAKEVDKRFDAHDKLAVYDLVETWELELRNLRDMPVTVTVREHHEGAWELEHSSAPHVREDAETLAFEITLQPGETQELSFRIRHRNR
ncbi:MAG: hypothetical protein U9R79_20275 [Armatimonadota bacterium]|nr:hypothetical protein [Armatimonadota bacterium]